MFEAPLELEIIVAVRAIAVAVDLPGDGVSSGLELGRGNGKHARTERAALPGCRGLGVTGSASSTPCVTTISPSGVRWAVRW